MLLSTILSPSPEQMMKALRFQYEEKLKSLRVENVRLQNLVAEREKLLRICGDRNSSLQREMASLQSQNQSQPVMEMTASPSQYAVEIPDFSSAEQSLQKAIALLQSEQFNEALLNLESLVRKHPRSPLADNAVYMMGEIYLSRGEPQLAEIEFLRLLEDFPSSERREDAIQKLKTMEHGSAKEMKNEDSN